MDELLHGVLYYGQEEEEEEEESLDDEDSETHHDESGDDEVDEDELRDKVAEKFGLDPEKDEELIEKLVESDKEHHKKLSGVIKQKISWRKKYEETSKNPDKSGKGKSQDKVETPDIDKLVDEKLSARLEARDLESLDLSDELKAEVKDLAKTKGISVREAANLPYIRFRKEEIEKEERLKKATPTRSKKGTSFTRSIDPSKPLNIDDFRTADGNVDAKAWNDAKAERDRLKKQ